MNNRKNYFIFLLATLSIFQDVIGQNRQILTQQMLDYLIPGQTRRNLLIDCNNIPSLPNCNYISNPEFFANVPNPNISNAFALGQISNWDASHGSPSLPDPFLGIHFSPCSNTFALLNMFASNINNTPYRDEGIVQKISPLLTNNQYVFRFSELIPNIPFTTTNTTLNEVNIYLIKCADDLNFPSNGTTQPPVPANSQLIYCASDLHATSYGMITDWKSRVLKFSANDNYDMIWVTAKMNGNPTNVLMFYCFDKPELFNINVLKSNITYNNCQATLSTPCNTICGALYTWTAPNGTTLIGPNQIIDTNVPGYVGNWTLTITLPNHCCQMEVVVGMFLI